MNDLSSKELLSKQIDLEKFMNEIRNMDRHTLEHHLVWARSEIHRLTPTI